MSTSTDEDIKYVTDRVNILPQGKLELWMREFERMDVLLEEDASVRTIFKQLFHVMLFPAAERKKIKEYVKSKLGESKEREATEKIQEVQKTTLSKEMKQSVKAKEIGRGKETKELGRKDSHQQGPEMSETCNPIHTSRTRPRDNHPNGLGQLSLEDTTTTKTHKRHASDDEPRTESPKRSRKKQKKKERKEDQDSWEQKTKEKPKYQPAVGMWCCKKCRYWNSKFFQHCRGYNRKTKRACDGLKREDILRIQEDDGIAGHEKERFAAQWLCKYCSHWNWNAREHCNGKGEDPELGYCGRPKSDACEYYATSQAGHPIMGPDESFKGTQASMKKYWFYGKR